MQADSREGKAAREAMGKLSGTDLAGFEAQLKTTHMFYTPAGRAGFHHRRRPAEDPGPRPHLLLRPRSARRERRVARRDRHRDARPARSATRRTSSSASTRPTCRWRPTGSSEQTECAAIGRTGRPAGQGLRSRLMNIDPRRPRAAMIARRCCPFLLIALVYAFGSAAAAAPRTLTTRSCRRVGDGGIRWSGSLSSPTGGPGNTCCGPTPARACSGC